MPDAAASPDRTAAPEVHGTAVQPTLGAESRVAVVAAVEAELAPLRSALLGVQPLYVGRRPAVAGTIDGVPVLLLAAGMGKVNAAQALTALLERQPLRGVLNLGVAGAYLGSRLAPPDIALASAEIYGDEGVDTPDGWISTEAIGIPLLEAGGRRVYNRFELDGRLLTAAHGALEAAGIDAPCGPFVTVSCCSGTSRRGAELADRFGALCESMEGAAFAHVCALYEVPFLELRGVSNAVEDRNLSRWRLHEAATAAAHAARLVLPVFLSA